MGDYYSTYSSLYNAKVGKYGSNLLFGTSHYAVKFLVNSGPSVKDSKHLS